MVILGCARVGCSASESADFYPGQPSVDDEPTLQVYLPEGWRVDLNGLDHVLHCPDHAVAT